MKGTPNPCLPGSDPCSAVICVDGATCVGGTCQCPAGLIGDGLPSPGGTGCTLPPCPDGFVMFEESCHKVVTTGAKNRADAAAKCEAMGAKLASITSQQEIQFFMTQSSANGYSGPFLIGLNDRMFEGVFIWEDNAGSDFRNWAPGQPGAQHRQDDCVVMDMSITFKWSVVSCDAAVAGFICTRLNDPDPECPRKWELIDGRCYSSSQGKYDYLHSYLFCTLNGADLAVIDSSPKQEALEKALTLTIGNYWFGLQRGFIDPWDGGLKYTNGQPLGTHTNWGPSGLVELDPPLECTYLEGTTGHWKIDECSQARRFVCCKDNKAKPVCPESWPLQFGKKCIHPQLSSKGVSAAAARTECEVIGGTLISVTSAGVNEFLMRLLSGGGPTPWIGLWREGGSDEFQWHDPDCIVDYLNWDTGSPSVAEANPACTVFRISDGKWRDKNCNAPKEAHQYICQFENQPCTLDSDCHANGECNQGQCRCQKGYVGDGVRDCVDINECSMKPCDKNAECENTIGSFKCECKAGFVGTGLVCEAANACKNKMDCHTNAKCVKKICKCNKGYTGDGKVSCANEDECTLNKHDCHADATCMDTEGGFDCTCNLGFHGDGKTCTKTQKDCHGYWVADNNADDGDYVIDPDGPNGLAPFTVFCEMRFDMGITVVSTTGGDVDRLRPLPATTTPKSHTEQFQYPSGVAPLLQLVMMSGFCYQDLTFECRQKVNLLGTTHWLDGLSSQQLNWGGEAAQQCFCGILGTCQGLDSVCNCDGISDTGKDVARITKKTLLPVTGIVTGNLPTDNAALAGVSKLRCGPKQFDVPIHCDAGKQTLDWKDDGEYWIDPDSPDGDAAGNEDIFLVHCDLNTYSHTGVTVVTHSQPGTHTPTGPVNTTLNYQPAPNNGVQKLINISGFCSQNTSYQCQLSGLLGQGAHYSVLDGSPRHHWGSAYTIDIYGAYRAVTNNCACGLNDACADTPGDTYNCHCDIRDNKTRHDLGQIILKADLPVVGLYLPDIGSGSTVSYWIGPLRCGEEQFGVPKSCQDILNAGGLEEANSYLVDPDGALARDATPAQSNANVKPFVVTCLIEEGDVGAGVINTIEGEIKPGPGAGVHPVGYKYHTKEQFEAFVDYAAYCTQSVEHECDSSARTHNASGANLIWWRGLVDGVRHDYFNGMSGNSCGCGASMSCIGGPNATCNCEGTSSTGGMKSQLLPFETEDIGFLNKKDDLPVGTIEVTAGASTNNSTFKVGGLHCYHIKYTTTSTGVGYGSGFELTKDTPYLALTGELWDVFYFYKNCYDIWTNYKPVRGEVKPKNGDFYIDPGMRQLGAPFKVECNFPKLTIMKTDSRYLSYRIDQNPGYPTTPGGQCKKYFYGASEGQLKALAASSGMCRQFVEVGCKHLPMSSHVRLFDILERRIPGFAGNLGGNECACGEMDVCAGGPDHGCNCDSEDGVLRKDRGWLIDKEFLPVRRLCYGFRENTSSDGLINYRVQQFTCGPDEFGIPRYCGGNRVEVQIIDPDGQNKGAPPMLVSCQRPPGATAGYTGAVLTVANGRQCVNSSGGDVKFKYNRASPAQIKALKDYATYCHQDLNFHCAQQNTGDILKVNGSAYGFYSTDGNAKNYWSPRLPNTDGDKYCAGCQCNAMDSQNHTDGGRLTHNDEVPVNGVKVNPTTDPDALRCVEVGPLHCERVFKHCEDIRVRGKRTPSRDNIDPDGPGPLPMFRARCDYRSQRPNGITFVRTSLTANGEARFEFNPNRESMHALAEISKQCVQRVMHMCRGEGPGRYRLKDYRGMELQQWVLMDNIVNATGCGCQLVGTCGLNETCHCHSTSKQPLFDEDVEEGPVTNRAILPITGVTNTGPGRVRLQNFACTTRLSLIPRDCSRAARQFYFATEVLIHPDINLDPFVAICQRIPGRPNFIRRTVIRPKQRTFVLKEGDTPIEYYQADAAQLAALVKVSTFCYQQVRIDCHSARLFVNGASWMGADGKTYTHWGNGQASKSECNCGRDNKCGGDDGKDNMKVRDCNCDVGDAKDRADAGTLTVGLPVIKFSMKFAGNGTANLTLGNLVCQDDKAVVPCNSYHDCHEQATCKAGKYTTYTCTCNKGWRGLARPDVYANGRECYDDDECKAGTAECPPFSECVNTIGSYECKCKKGYKRAGKRCVDVNECTESNENVTLHDCGKDAVCYNTIGSFFCRCKDGFRGDGKQCFDYCTCLSYGDPHLRTFDGTQVDFQGLCLYLMARDGCTNGFPNGPPNFEVLVQNWNNPAYGATGVSWPKEVYVRVGSTLVKLGPGYQVHINGQTITRLPMDAGNGVIVRSVGFSIGVFTDFGVEVLWSGTDRVTVSAIGSHRGSLCGLCGDCSPDGNKTDDLRVGPQCPDHNPGSVTTGPYIWGHSWTVQEFNKTCEFDCNEQPPPPCTPDAIGEAEQICDSSDDVRAAFQDCLDAMSPEERKQWQDSCVYDVCHVKRESKGVIYCAYLLSLEKRCEVLNLPPTPWRGPNVCAPPPCPYEGQVFQDCGDPCTPGCFDLLQNKTSTCSSSGCVPGCYCPEDMVLDSDKCVPKDNCTGCVYNGRLWTVGESHVDLVNCSEITTCESTGVIKKTPFNCSAMDNAICNEDDGIACECAPGYKPFRVKPKILLPCINVNECEKKADCFANSICEDTPGSYECPCVSGYSGDGKVADCVDIDECKTDKHSCDLNTTYCKNSIGGFECRCLEGYMRNDTFSCKDKDECALRQDQCDRESTNCTNTPGFYKCDCKDGFKPIEGNELRCADVDECNETMSHDCVSPAFCENTVGGFQCDCPKGFTLQGEKNCEDVDECKLKLVFCNDAVTNTVCNNTIGGADCVCAPGYEPPLHTSYFLRCNDIDECARNLSNCLPAEQHGTCKNINGSFECGCEEGYTGDGQVPPGTGCLDVNECTIPGKKPCGENSKCSNTIGGFTCQCDPYYQSRSGTHKDCEPVSKCTDTWPAPCGANTRCRNTTTGAECACKDGFKFVNGSLTTCEDFDECKENQHNCLSEKDHGICNNTAGSFECSCAKGYKGDGQRPPGKGCKDVDECKDNLHDCNETTEKCRNNDGGFICMCKEGYKFGFDKDLSPICEDINECDTGKHDCHKNAYCNNTIGSFICGCKDGYMGNGRLCEDIKECSDTSNPPCDENAKCIEEDGGFRCECFPGYEGPGTTCKDIDECKTNAHNCTHDALCQNTEGGYFCACLPGFVGHCEDCEDINECDTGLHTCHKHADCKNTPGAFDCTCRDGYQGDGKKCTDINECLDDSLNNCDVDNGQCINNKGSYYCVCDFGFILVNHTCVDVDECLSPYSGCHPHADCHNTPGSFYCSCHPGYEGDGRVCKREKRDKDCGGIKCDKHAYCDYDTCVCYPGFRGNGKKCEVFKPCGNGVVCDEHATCYDVMGAPKCVCNDGYYGNGFECEKEDHCAPNPCSSPAECVPDYYVQEGYHCVCPDGYYGDTPTTCKDINECDQNPCGQNELCHNAYGSYFCVCPVYGYYRKVNYYGESECTDIDECTDPNYSHDCHEAADCYNTDGGYTCECKYGYTGDGRFCEPISDCDRKCPSNGVCIKLNGESFCQCPSGFEIYHGECVDIDECKGYHDCHELATCHNAEGYYYCECPKGYYGNGHFCVEIDECKQGAVCSEHADCKNNEGSYECTCKDGYEGDGHDCRPVHADKDPCGCGKYGVCDVYSMKCYCKPGFAVDTFRDKDKCQDINSCLQPRACHPAATCTDAFGGYFCDCPSGMVGDGHNYCDVDECYLNLHDCGKHAICKNNVGGFTCTCKDGYRGDGHKCVKEKSPCEEHGLVCGEHAYCLGKKKDSLQCRCHAGYEGDGIECTDIDECKPGKHSCSPYAYCYNLPGGYDCECLPGFQGNGYVCKDINECKTNRNNCSQNAYCKNKLGTYECECVAGYEGDGRTCTELETCLNDGEKTSCAPYADCVPQSTGHMACECGDGFTGIGTKKCYDVDECYGGKHNCHKNAKCVNTPGAFHCVCKPGYFGDGYYCQDINECLYTKPVCKQPFVCINTPGSYECDCPPGTVYSKPYKDCINVNECADGGHNDCHKHAICEDKSPGYTCTCKEGFYGNGFNCYREDHDCKDGYVWNPNKRKCVDTNECALPGYDVCPNGECKNTDGGYTCQCPDGFIRNKHGHCFEKDECRKNPCPYGSKCLNLIGSYTCDCPPGFYWDGFNCTDRNECLENYHACGYISESICTNTIGSFKCSCRKGFALKKGRCQDVDECRDPYVCGHNPDIKCLNYHGGYECKCPSGYEQKENTCIDIDECKRGFCHPMAYCKNTPGGYSCSCPKGYRGDGCSCNRMCGPHTCPPQQSCHVHNGVAVCSCHCTGSQCLQTGPVCGTDGLTYDSDRQLFEISCGLGLNIKRNYRGECQDYCYTVKCSKPHQICVDTKDGPLCKCPNACEIWDIEGSLVCGSDGLTYATRCLFEFIQCVEESPHEIRHKGICIHAFCRYMGWTEWSHCSTKCGGGVQTRTRVPKSPKDAKGRPCKDTYQSRPCYNPPCPGSKCAKKHCRQPESVCVEKGRSVACVCPVCRGTKKEPVCGIIDGDRCEKTFFNLCHLRRQACRRDKQWEFLHFGKCKKNKPLEPINCTMVPEFVHVDLGYAISRDRVGVNRCGGGCQANIGLCCRPNKTKKISVPFVGKYGKKLFFYYDVETVWDCSCQKAEEIIENESKRIGVNM